MLVTFPWWFPVVLVALSVLMASIAGARLARVARRFREPRLGHLAAFFLLFSLAQAALVVEALVLQFGPEVRVRGSIGAPVVLFWLRHGALLVALAAAVIAVGPPWRWRREGTTNEQAHLGAPFFLLAYPVLMILEGAALFYLVIRTAWNHTSRANPGSLYVALGFVFLLVGHAVPWLVEGEGPMPLGAPHWVAVLFVLAGMSVLTFATGGRVGSRGRGGGPGG